MLVTAAMCGGGRGYFPLAHPHPLPTTHALSRGPSQGEGGPGEAWVTHASRTDASTSWHEDRHTVHWQATMSGPSPGQDLEATDLGPWDPYLEAMSKGGGVGVGGRGA